MKTSEDILARDEIVSEDGRIFRPRHKELLETMPPDIVSELARRQLKELEQNKNEAYEYKEH